MAEFRVRWLVSFALKFYQMGCKVPALGDLQVLHLSDHFLVVNKVCDVPINSDRPDAHPLTVADQLNHAFPHLADPRVAFGFRFCHRLDYSTSGLLCVALSKDAAGHAYAALRTRTADKFYLALVRGHVHPARQPLALDKAVGADSRPEHTHRMCTADKAYCVRPKASLSRLLVLQRGLYDGSPASKVLLKPVSGRRHQLRVHCHDLGHTVVGDYTYSGRTDLFPHRMFLHALRLRLPCPLEHLDVCSEDPFAETDPRNKWRPLDTVHPLDDAAFSLLS